MELITDFILIRHGQTGDNLTGLLQGHRNSSLDETGIQQAECAARRLQKNHFDVIYSSDLDRSFKTAEIIAVPHNLPVIPCPALREWHLGDLEGRHRQELIEKYPEIMNSFKYESGDIPVPGGESRKDLYRRVSDCLDELAARHAGQKILLVSHAGTIRAMFHHIVGRVSGTAMLPQVGNGSYSRFCRRENLWQLCTWNDVSHLAQIGFRDSVTF